MRGITQGRAFLGLQYLLWCWLLAGKRLLKLLKLNNSFIVSFLQQWIILGPNTKNLIGFLVGMIFFGGGEYSPLWMPRINTDCNSQFTDVGLVGMKRGAETLYAYFQKRPTV